MVDTRVDGRRITPILLGASFLLLGSCSPAPPSPPVDSLALRDTLMGLIERAYDFDAPGAVERMNALYSETGSGPTVSASGGELTVSTDSVRQGIATFWEEAGRNMRAARWTWEDVYTEPLGLDAAVLTGTWSIPHIAPDGQPHIIEGAWTAVFRRIGGEWKIVHEHLSVPSR